MNIIGKSTLLVQFNDQILTHDFIVIDSCDTPNLLGRDLCTKLNINFLLPDEEKTHSLKSNAVLSEFSDYLSPSFKSCVEEKVTLHLLPNAQAKFCKARPVPIKLRGAVKSELDRLVRDGIVTKVFSSNWASPVVNVRKADGSIRLCGDFSVSVNKYLDVTHTPLPTIEEVIASVGDAKVFSVLDCSNAYSQLLLDDASRELTTINTSEGLYRYNYLAYGLKSSPSIFQSFMTKVLNGVDNIII